MRYECSLVMALRWLPASPPARFAAELASIRADGLARAALLSWQLTPGGCRPDRWWPVLLVAVSAAGAIG